LKLQCLTVGGVLGALGGLVLALDSNFLDPSYWRSDVTFLIYAALILGGVGRVFAPAVGAVLLWFIIQFTDSLLRQLVDNGAITFLSGSDIGLSRFVMVGLALMGLMIFRPQGIFGRREDVLLDERG